MNIVCTSVSETLNKCYEDMIRRTQNDRAIYGTASYHQTLITEYGRGIRPTLSGSIIHESEPRKIRTDVHDGIGYTYSVSENLDIASFNSATKDDLYLFITMAHPKVLQNENLRNVIFSRLSQIYEEEFANAGENANIIQQQQEIDREKLE